MFHIVLCTLNSLQYLSKPTSTFISFIDILFFIFKFILCKYMKTISRFYLKIWYTCKNSKLGEWDRIYLKYKFINKSIQLKYLMLFLELKIITKFSKINEHTVTILYIFTLLCNYNLYYHFLRSKYFLFSKRYIKWINIFIFIYLNII